MLLSQTSIIDSILIIPKLPTTELAIFSPCLEVPILTQAPQTPKLRNFGTPRQNPVRIRLGWMRERMLKSGLQKWYPLSDTFRAPGLIRRWHRMCQKWTPQDWPILILSLFKRGCLKWQRVSHLWHKVITKVIRKRAKSGLAESGRSIPYLAKMIRWYKSMLLWVRRVGQAHTLATTLHLAQPAL